MKRRNFLATAGAIISTGGSMSLIGNNANAKFNFGLKNQSKFTTADISSDNLIFTFSNISLDYDNFKQVNKDIKIQVYTIVNNISSLAREIPVSVDTGKGSIRESSGSTTGHRG